MADIVAQTQFDPEDVLREYGLDGLPTVTTVIQQTIAHSEPVVEDAVVEEIIPLTPPPIEAMDSPRVTEAREALEEEIDRALDSVMEDLTPNEDDLIESMIEATEAANAIPTSSSTASIAPIFDEVDDVVAAIAVNAITESSTIEEVVNALPVNTYNPIFNDTSARFSGAIWYKKIQEATIILAGMGGIGSNVFYNLTRMHPRQVFIYDDDTVETVNLAGQMYSKKMIGNHKVDAMAEMARDYSDYHGTMAVSDRFTKNTPASDIMICGFDNMQARKDFFEVWVRHVQKHKNPEQCLFIDGRLAFEDMQVFCLTGDYTEGIKRYQESYLFNDSQAEETVCSMKQTTYCATMIGSIITNLFTNFIANSIAPFTHILPFKTYYNANMMYFKIED